MIRLEKQPRRDLKQLSDEELEKYVELAASETRGRKIAMEELARRRTKAILKFRWGLAPTIEVAVLAIVGAVIVALLVVLWID